MGERWKNEGGREAGRKGRREGSRGQEVWGAAMSRRRDGMQRLRA